MNDKKADKRVLVVYYSLTGKTARVARDLAARLNADVVSQRRACDFNQRLSPSRDGRVHVNGVAEYVPVV